MLALLLAQRPRQLHVDDGVEVAALVGLADDRHAVSLQPEHLAALRRLRNLQADRAGDRRHVRLAAEDGGRHRHADARAQIVAVALEHRMRPQPHAKIEIAGGAAARTAFTFARRADARPVLDAGRNADVDAARVSAFLDRDAPRGAVERFLERQLDFVLDVAPLLRARRARAPS